MIKTAVQFFGVIVAGALLASLLGGAFGGAVAIVSPRFVRELFSIETGEDVTRYAVSVGMIWGLFIGTAVAGFACFLSVLLRILRLWIGNPKKEIEPADGAQPPE